MRRALLLDASPALRAPLRFFVNAPVFGLLAAAMLALGGPDAFASRWSPYALAATHLLTLGVFASVMTGALMQILPVAAGVRVARTETSATVVHALLTLGTLVLAAAFVTSIPWLFPLGALLLAAAFLWLIVACAIGLWLARREAAGQVREVLLAIRLALAALFVTVVLGAALACLLTWPRPADIVALTNWHLAWGLAGWIGLLTAGVAYQVIPMFQVTEPYPRPLTRWLAPVAFAALAGITVAAFASAQGALLQPAQVGWAAAPLWASYALFAAVTLHLLATRKRPEPDTTTLFWCIAMASVIACGPVWAIAVASSAPPWPIAAGVLLLVGAIGSAINGMLYKIIPFLLWYHVQAAASAVPGAAPIPIPKVKDMLPDRAARSQFYAHVAALLLLVGATAAPAWLAWPAAAAFGVSAAWLGVNIAGALKRYARAMRRVASSARAGRTQP